MKKLLKIIFQPFINLGMRLLFPKFKNRDYYTLRILLVGIRQRLVGINKNVPWPVNPTTVIYSPQNIVFNYADKPPGITISCYLDARNGINIGRNVWIGPRVSIISQDHDSNNYTKYITAKPIKIGENCLLTANCVILPEVELGPHTIVAANSVVRDSFPDGNQILAGNPAKLVKKLGEYKG